MSTNLVVGLGRVAVFAIVRFPNVLRTRSTPACARVIIMGTACGTQSFSTAIIGGPVIRGASSFICG